MMSWEPTVGSLRRGGREPSRTTIDLPPDAHDAARSIARDRGTTLSEVVSDLIRRDLGRAGTVEYGRSAPFATCPMTEGALVRFW